MTPPNNLSHVLNMVLYENKGQVLTEALIVGIERCVAHYMNAVESNEKAAVDAAGKENKHGT